MPLRNRSLAMGDKQVTGLADGVDPADAVNKSQLDAVASDAGDALDTHETTYHSNIADQRVMANISGDTGQPSPNTLTAILDDIFGADQGAIITRTDTGWGKTDPGTDGYFLKSNGAGANISYAEIPPPFWTPVVKTSSQNVASSTTLVDDSELVVPVLANTDYLIRAVLLISSGAGGFQISCNGPASPNAVYPQSFSNPSAGNFNITAGSALLTYGSTLAANSAVGTLRAVLPMNFYLSNGANAGNFVIQFTQNSSNLANTTMLAGSYLEYAEI